MPIKKPRLAEHSYWEAPWVECEFVPGEVWELGSRRQKAQTKVNSERTNAGGYCGAFYQNPLSRTILNPELYIRLEASLDEARARFNWMSSSVRGFCGNRVATFLIHYQTPEGRAWLMDHGLRLFDDDGSTVDSRGHRIENYEGYSGLDTQKLWQGDKSLQVVALKAKTLSLVEKEKSNA